MNRALRLTLFTLWTVLMTALAYILGAPSLRVLRRRLGRANYWLLITAISTGFFLVHSSGADFRTLAYTFASLSALIGVFEEFEEMGFGFLKSAAFAVLINSMVATGAFALWTYFTGPSWGQVLLNYVETTLKPVSELNPHLQINYLDLMLQLPSIAVVLWLGALYLAVLCEDRLAVGDLAPVRKLPSLRPQLRELRLPDVYVWFFILSVLGAFYDFSNRSLEAFAVNAMNVCVLLFFFQGLAVLSRFVTGLKLGVFWQALLMVLVVVQFFLLVSVLGLLDFWLDFRVRLAKRSAQMNRESQ